MAKIKSRHILLKALATATALIAGCIAFSSFVEWWTVGVKGKTSGYPWGPINDNPWYYRTPLLYAANMLVEFTILATGLSLMTYFIAKRRKEKAFYSILLIWGIIIDILINGAIR